MEAYIHVGCRRLDECQFLTLRLFKATLDRVRLFKLFKSQDDKKGIS